MTFNIFKAKTFGTTNVYFTELAVETLVVRRHPDEVAFDVNQLANIFLDDNVTCVRGRVVGAIGNN